MAIKFKAKTKEETPAQWQSLYVEREGGFVLDVEGAVDQARLEEFRASNVGLMRERDALNNRLTATQIDQGVIGSATKRGLRSRACADGLPPSGRDAAGLRGRWTNGACGKDGIAPMTLDEWVDQQVADAPHLFESNAGGGGGGATSPYGNGSGGAGTKSVKNPFRKESWNLTEQMKLQKTDPGLPARLKAAA